ncbi:MAG: peptidase T [Acholeplasmataceae bacterium]
MQTLIDRFIRYAKIETTSDPNSHKTPSTNSQLNLSRLLVDELKEFGLDAYLDDKGYVYTKINSNINKKVKSIGFIAHVDTSSDAPGLNVSPKIINNYDGKTIKLNDRYSLDPNEFSDLKDMMGDDLITTDGNTLLGADNKAGVSIIMEMAKILTSNEDIKHGDIYICFTPDEEIGRGADHFNYDYFKADFAYTVDGGKAGSIEYENFNASTAKVTFKGVSIHPGSAKNKLINSVHLFHEFHQMLPKFLDPSNTSGYEGFNHLVGIKGSVEETNATYIIRNHDYKLFKDQENEFNKIKDYLNDKYKYNAVDLLITESYLNMNEIIKDHPEVIEIAKKAIVNVGLKPISEPIRGGTDGARLTYGGLICPNLGTGGYNFHGRLEYLNINEFIKSLEVVLEIINLVKN